MGSSLLAAILLVVGWLRPVDGVLHDLMLQLRGERPTSPEIVICTIDGDSIDRYGRWPWSRTILANLVDRLDQAGASTIVFDVIFSEPSPGSDGRVHDARLAQAMADHGNVVLGLFLRNRARDRPPTWFDPEDPGRRTSPEALRDEAINVIGNPEPLQLPEAAGVEANLDLFAAVTTAGFSTNWRESGVLRRAQTLAGLPALGGDILPALGLRAVSRFTGQPLELLIDERRLPTLEFSGRTIPIDERGFLRLDFAGDARAFSTVSARALLDEGVDGEGDSRAPPIDLAGKLVFVGLTDRGVGDFVASPFGFEIPGVAVHATMADNLLTGRFLRERGLERFVSVLALLLIAPLAAFLVASIERYLVGSLVAIGLVLAWPPIAMLVFQNSGRLLSVSAPMVGGIVALLIALRYQIGTVEARAQEIKRTFQRYVSETVVDQMLADPDRVRLGGERREMTVLFSDIRGFTSLAERLDSEEVVQLLNRFFTPMTRLVLAEGGTLDKYMGDALMAFYGAPLEQPDHAACACRSALAMREALVELNAYWRAESRLRPQDAVGIGIGLNSGPMSVGNMGSEEIFDYTVIGDNVNLGSRVEGLNKLYGTEILVTENTVEALWGEDFLLRELDRVRVKGKNEPVALYELLGERPVSEDLETLATQFAQALDLYRQAEFTTAAERFEDLAERYDDPPSKALAARCRRLETEPPGADWRAVETLTSK